MSPLERTEAFYEELTRWYGDGREPELRAASKLLMVALLKFEQHGGENWHGIVQSYLDTSVRDPERFLRMIESQRGETKTQPAPG